MATFLFAMLNRPSFLSKAPESYALEVLVLIFVGDFGVYNFAKNICDLPKVFLHPIPSFSRMKQGAVVCTSIALLELIFFQGATSLGVCNFNLCHFRLLI